MAKETIIVTFETIADAMALESLCDAQQVSGRLIPTPRSLSAGCGLSWCSDMSEEASLIAMLSQEISGQIKIEGEIQRLTSN